MGYYCILLVNFTLHLNELLTMRWKGMFGVAVLLLCFIEGIRGQSIYWLGTLGGSESYATDVSGDGRVVVGISLDREGRTRAFRWTRESGMRDLGTLGGDNSWAYSVTYDGTIIVGTSIDSQGRSRAFYWTVNGGMRDLGTLGRQSCCSEARDVSANGTIIVGTVIDDSGRVKAVLWDRGRIRDLRLGGERSIAESISADGEVIVGHASKFWYGAGGSYRWSVFQAHDLFQQRDSSMHSGDIATCVSADGSIIVGTMYDLGGISQAFRWTATGGIQGLGNASPTAYMSEATSVSADGSIVVGNYIDSLETIEVQPFRWTEQGGMHSLNQLYAALLQGQSSLRSARAISSNGRYIVGQGRNSFGPAAWEAYVLDTCPGGDSDQDGICDDYERGGVDVNHDGTIDLDLRSLGARVGIRDVFVEYDSMTEYRPSDSALAKVVAAFLTHGIAVHFVDGGDTIVPEYWYPFPWRKFDVAKKQYFGTPIERNTANWNNIQLAKRQVFRYCIFAYQIDLDGSSGMGELPGDDFMVTLGDVNFQNLRDTLPANWNRRRVTWDDFVAGTILHELGHTLGLLHGGDDYLNYKPNYHSVMNYLWQFPYPPYAASWVVNYSDRVFNTLTEDSLSEMAGIGGHSGHHVPIRGRSGWLVPEAGAIDWNADGDVDDYPVQLDINADGYMSRLRSHSDWNNLDLTLRGPNWVDGVHLILRGVGIDAMDTTDVEPIKEMTYSMWENLVGELGVGGIKPEVVLDTGIVEAIVFGSAFEEGMRVWLEKEGEQIVGNVIILGGKVYLRASFDVRGMRRGKWDVVVRSRGGSEARMDSVFEIASSLDVGEDNGNQGIAVQVESPIIGGQGGVLWYWLSEAGIVHVKIVDVLGREQVVLSEGWRLPGKHEMVLPMLHNGVYSVMVGVGRYVATSRLVVIR